MADKEPFSLIYAPAVDDHLAAIDRKHHSLIRDKLEQQLEFGPGQATRNRKPLKQPAAFGATWELRFGPANRFRVLYAIEDAPREVHILAIGVKERNKLVVGGEEIDL